MYLAQRADETPCEQVRERRRRREAPTRVRNITGSRRGFCEAGGTYLPYANESEQALQTPRVVPEFLIGPDCGV